MQVLRHRMYPLLGSVFALGASWFALVPLAHAEYPQPTCTNAAYVPTLYGDAEFDKANGVYGNNEDFTWTTFTSGNVASCQPHLLNWNTETADGLTLTAYNQLDAKGNFGTIWSRTPLTLSSATLNGFVSRWYTNGSTSYAVGSTIDQMYCECVPGGYQTSQAPIRSIQPNTRYDLLFAVPNDVFYLSVSLPANKAMVVTLDVNESTDERPDYDLFISSSVQRPDVSNRDYIGYHGNPLPLGADHKLDAAGEAVYIPAATYSRTMYIGARAYTGLGHASLRANITTPKTIKLCTQDVTPAQLLAKTEWEDTSSVNYPGANETLRRAFLRVFQMTHGNLLVKQVNVAQNATTHSCFAVQNEWCDDSCDVCMNAPNCDTNNDGDTLYNDPDNPWGSDGDGCGWRALSNGQVRVANWNCWSVAAGCHSDDTECYTHPVNFSLGFAHEFGHNLRRLWNPGYNSNGFTLNDEYSSTGAFCYHSIMAGPWDWVPTADYRLCTDLNHCKSGDGDPSKCGGVPSNWTALGGSGAIGQYWYGKPSSTTSSQPWVRFVDNYWARRELISFTAQ